MHPAGYGFLSFARNFSKGLSSRYSLKLIVRTKNKLEMKLKRGSKTASQKTAKSTGNLIGKKIAEEVTRKLKDSKFTTVETPKRNTKRKIPFTRKKINKLLMNLDLCRKQSWQLIILIGKHQNISALSLGKTDQAE